jgi:hypothetical protein
VIFPRINVLSHGAEITVAAVAPPNVIKTEGMSIKSKGDSPAWIVPNKRRNTPTPKPMTVAISIREPYANSLPILP